jgi:hypothetical protein
MTTTESISVVADRMSENAATFIDSLDKAQREKASFGLDDTAERTDWGYFPRDHKGLPLHEMTLAQQKATHALVASALSLPTYARVTSIIALENVLNLLEERRADGVRDPARYFVSIFGSPADDRWGWRFEGHHVCLNFTIIDGEVFSTPIFLGANPAEVRHGEAPVVRPCAEEEDVARELLASLDNDQLRATIISDIAPPDFVLTNIPLVPDHCAPGEAGGSLNAILRFDKMPEHAREALVFERERPRGLAASDMDASQRRVLDELVDVYVDRLPEPLARTARERIDVGAAHFAWAGETERRREHYYRVQGPSLLIEYDNTQNNANHVHAVWRDPTRDFGMDALREHVRSH